jgi:chemotaxis protein histidine kinase CheA
MSGDRPEGSDEAELLRSLFLDEAQSHLAEIAEAQQALAGAHEDGERLAAVEAMLRHLHTLKGAAGSVGF